MKLTVPVPDFSRVSEPPVRTILLAMVRVFPLATLTLLVLLRMIMGAPVLIWEVPLATMLLKLTPAAGALVRVRELAVSVVRLPRVAEGADPKSRVLAPVTLRAIELRLMANKVEVGAKATEAMPKRAVFLSAVTVVVRLEEVISLTRTPAPTMVAPLGALAFHWRPVPPPGPLISSEP